MLFARVKLSYEKLQEKGQPEKLGFKFTKNHKSTTLYTSDSVIYERFQEHLENFCVLQSFKEKYHVEKMIGKGSFGKVDFVVCLKKY